MDHTPPSNVIPFPRRRRAVAIPPTVPPQEQAPKVTTDCDLGLTRFGSHILVTTPGVKLDEELVIVPAVPPADARLIAEKLLVSARVAECSTCAPRLAEATEGEVYAANAVGLCAECSA